MKKVFVALATLVIAGAAVGQAPFTIVRPQEGQKVRETVNIVFPRGSVPQGTFIGVSVDGKFVEATVPEFDEKANGLVYRLDTKTRGIDDGPRTIAVALYSRRDGRPAIVERSEVNVTVGNQMDINVPPDGLLINYRFTRGQRSVYQIDVGQEVSTLTEVQNRLGGRAAQLPLGQESRRLLFSVDDVRPGGIGLVRTQLLPYVGKDYLVVTASGDPGPTKHVAEEFAAIYRLLRPTGHEEYADIPHYFGMPGTRGGKPVDTDLFDFVPLPILPAERLSPGDSWQASIAWPMGSILEVRDTGQSLTRRPARGTFERVEWEQGHPTARLRYEIEVARRTGQTEALRIAGREFADNDRQRLQQTVWISLRDGRLVRSDLIFEGDMRLEPQQEGAAGGPGGPGGAQAGPTAAGTTGAGAGGGQAMGEGAGAAPPPPGGPGGQGVRGGPQQGMRGGQQVSGPAFVRTKLYVKMVLEN